VALDPGYRYSFGRTAQAGVLLPDVRVSRAHGDLEVHDGRWTFTDLGSANGSFLFRVGDLVHTEVSGADLPCVRLEPGQRGRLRPGDGVLLGCRDAWIELLPHPPPGALPNLVGANPPSVLAVLGIESVAESETPDLRWPSETPELPEPRTIADPPASC
jgi:hypothetical protein